VIWCFWNPVRSEDRPISNWVSDRAWRIVGGFATAFVVAFSILLATFPGEFLNDRFAMPLRETLFAGAADEVSGRPRSLFSNRLVLTDQIFVDSEKMDKIEVSHSFRGRDLRQAVLNRADLRKADFTGAMLNQAGFELAKLQKARFGCADTGRGLVIGEIPSSPVGCTSLRGANFDGAQLQDSVLDQASLEGAHFARAQLQGSVLEEAALEAAYFGGAQLQGANLKGARLRRANFELAQLQGADFSYAELNQAWFSSAHLNGANFEHAKLQSALLSRAYLQGANFFSAWLPGAEFFEADLQGTYFGYSELQGANLFRAQAQAANFFKAQLQGANLEGAGPQGSVLEETGLQGANLRGTRMWRARGIPEIALADLDGLDPQTKPWETETPFPTFDAWRDRLLEGTPAVAIGTYKRDNRGSSKSLLSELNPDSDDREDVIKTEFWENASLVSPKGKERDKQLADLLVKLACSSNSAAPHIAPALLRHGRIEATGSQIATVADTVRKAKSDQTVCPGVSGFFDEDWKYLDEVVAKAVSPR
jgi:uncharacterized protein YjbI with pentapeptide repeats